MLLVPNFGALSLSYQGKIGIGEIKKKKNVIGCFALNISRALYVVRFTKGMLNGSHSNTVGRLCLVWLHFYDVTAEIINRFSENGDVYVWGSNGDRQLGLEAIVDSVSIRSPVIVPIVQPVVYVSCGHSHTAFVTSKRINIRMYYDR